MVPVSGTPACEEHQDDQGLAHTNQGNTAKESAWTTVTSRRTAKRWHHQATHLHDFNPRNLSAIGNKEPIVANPSLQARQVIMILPRTGVEITHLAKPPLRQVFHRTLGALFSEDCGNSKLNPPTNTISVPVFDANQATTLLGLKELPGLSGSTITFPTYRGVGADMSTGHVYGKTDVKVMIP